MIGVFAFSLLGFGCGGGSSASEVGPWWLSFDMPSGWAMYANYSKSIADPSTLNIERKLTDVIIQSTTLPIVLPGKSAGDEVTSFVDKDFTHIRVYRYDVNLTKIPGDAEDIGNGFYKLAKDDKVTYYLKGQYGNYKFVITQDGRDIAEAEKVILSAVESADPAKTVTEETEN